MGKIRPTLAEVYSKMWQRNGSGEFGEPERRSLRGTLQETGSSRLEITWGETEGASPAARKILEMSLAEYGERTGRLQVCEPTVGHLAVQASCQRVDAVVELSSVADLLPVY
jgi:hypothetical protein